MKPLRTFVLYRGYAESASISAVILTHREGFDSVQEGLISIRSCIGKYIEFHNRSYEVKKGYTQELEHSNETFERLFDEYHRSINDDGFNELEEFLGQDGWIVLPYEMHSIDVHRLVVVNYSAELIATAGTWDRNQEIDVTASYCLLPPGLKYHKKYIYGP